MGVQCPNTRYVCMCLCVCVSMCVCMTVCVCVCVCVYGVLRGLWGLCCSEQMTAPAGVMGSQ